MDAKLDAFAAKDGDEIRRELVEAMRLEKPDITQEEIDTRLGLVEATIGF